MLCRMRFCSAPPVTRFGFGKKRLEFAHYSDPFWTSDDITSDYIIKSLLFLKANNFGLHNCMVLFYYDSGNFDEEHPIIL